MEGRQNVRLIAVPYYSGHRGLRTGAGPEYFLENGLGEALRTEGQNPSFTTASIESEPLTEVATAFELDGVPTCYTSRTS